MCGTVFLPSVFLNFLKQQDYDTFFECNHIKQNIDNKINTKKNIYLPVLKALFNDNRKVIPSPVTYIGC